MAKKDVIIDVKVNKGNSDKTINDVKKNLNDLGDKAGEAGSKVGESIGNISPRFAALRQQISTIGNALKAAFASPIGIILLAVASAIGVLVAAFKDFSPLVDGLADTLKGLSAAFNQALTNIRNFFTGNEANNKSLRQAYEMGKLASSAMRDYEDAIGAVNLKSAQYEKAINILLKQAKNQNITFAERNKLLAEAMRLQEAQIKLEQEQASRQSKSLILEAMAANATAAQIRQIQQGALLSEIVGLDDEKTKLALKNYQEYLQQKLSKEQSFEGRRERINNLIDANENKRLEDAKKRADEEIAAREKQHKAILSYIKDFEELQQKQADYEKKRKASLIQSRQEEYEYLRKTNEDIINNESEFFETRLAAMKEALEKGWLTQKQYDDLIIKNDQLVRAEKMKMVQSTADIFAALSSLAGENEAASKTFALMQIAADTATAISGALASSMSPKSVDNQLTGGVAGVAKFLAISGIILTQAARAKQVLTTKSFSGTSGGQGMALGAPPIVRATSSQVNLNGNQMNQLQQGSNQRVYVLENDITTTQSKVAVIQNKATIG